MTGQSNFFINERKSNRTLQKKQKDMSTMSTSSSKVVGQGTRNSVTTIHSKQVDDGYKITQRSEEITLRRLSDSDVEEEAFRHEDIVIPNDADNVGVEVVNILFLHEW